MGGFLLKGRFAGWERRALSEKDDEEEYDEPEGGGGRWRAREALLKGEFACLGGEGEHRSMGE